MNRWALIPQCFACDRRFLTVDDMEIEGVAPLKPVTDLLSYRELPRDLSCWPRLHLLQLRYPPVHEESRGGRAGQKVGKAWGDEQWDCSLASWEATPSGSDSQPVGSCGHVCQRYSGARCLGVWRQDLLDHLVLTGIRALPQVQILTL